MHASESTLDSGTASHSSRHDMLVVISSRYQYGPFLFCCRSVSNYLTTDGLKNFSLLPETPLRPEARGICHICHVVNPVLLCVCVSVCVCTHLLDGGANWRHLANTINRLTLSVCRAVGVYVGCLRAVLSDACDAETVQFQLNVTSEMIRAATNDVVGNCDTLT